jgi:hypothetical protein
MGAQEPPPSQRARPSPEPAVAGRPPSGGPPSGGPPSGGPPAGTSPVLPDVSSDEDGVGWGDWREEREDDERFIREIPPHHGTY